MSNSRPSFSLRLTTPDWSSRRWSRAVDDCSSRLSTKNVRPPGLRAALTVSQNTSNCPGGTCESQNEKKTTSKVSVAFHEKMSASTYSTLADRIRLRLIASTSGDASTATTRGLVSVTWQVQRPV